MARSEITEVGKYRILGQIGEGAMGVVYRALDPVLNRPVAIKVMSDAVARDAELRGRFLREAQAAGSLQHPNVVTIYDFGEVEGHLFIAMEFVEGADLEELLRKKLPLSVLEKIDILIDVLTGLSYAHKRGIIHRDIKPANIRIDQEGRARIMDFGIAHLTSSNITRTGVMVGTPAYMAPEQIVGGEITPASDIFAVGAVMYELLTGKKPFQGETLQSVMYKIVSQAPPSIAKVASDVPTSLATIVERALAKEPTSRFGSAVEMASSLSAARAEIAQNPRSSTPLSLRSSIATALADEKAAKARSVVVRRIAMGAGGIGVVAAAALAVMMWPRNADAPGPPPAATPATQALPPVQQPTATNPSAANTPAVSSSPAPRLEPPPPSTPTSTARQPLARGAQLPPPATPTTPSAKELRLFQSLLATAMQTRRRASEAGATAEQLDVGDAHNRSANELVARGKVTEAAEKLDQATAAWSSAERLARLAAASARAAVPDAPKPQATTSAPTVVTQTPTLPQAPPATQPSPVTPQPPPNPTADINAVVAAYERAIESRDIAAMRRVYPVMTATQARGFEDFFARVRSLRATFTVSGLEISGATAEAQLAGTYDYIGGDGKPVQQKLSLLATFRREGGMWQIASVR